jgi:hypothetical protein
MFCQDIKCPDYLADGGEPAWCFKAGCPAVVAAGKCPKTNGEPTGHSEKKGMRRNKNEEQTARL